MRLLIALTYYRPHISGLTIYAQRLAEGLAARGHGVTVLTSQYDPNLPRREAMGGVEVVRVPVALRVSKGVFMRGYARVAEELLRASDVVILNLPATPHETVWLPRRLGTKGSPPSIAIHHCDLKLPGHGLNRMLSAAVNRTSRMAAGAVDRLVAYTDEYARFSSVLSRFPEKVVVIPPPVVAQPTTPEATDRFRQSRALGDGPLIGIVARLAAEKGVEHMLHALRDVCEAFPGTRLLLVGEHENVTGEERYRASIAPLIREHGDAVGFMGKLTDEELPSFYAACDVTVLPSTNHTESFGLVQVESMLCGTPVVASDLPGVRVPVSVTGMGRLAAPGDSSALARVIIEVLRGPSAYVKPRAFIEQHYSLRTTLDRYEELLQSLADPDALPGPSARGVVGGR